MDGLASAWDPAPTVVVGAGVVLALFVQAFARLRRRGRADHAGWSRLLLFLIAVALGTLSLVSPLDEVGDSYLLSGHMLQHVLIGDAAPALALVALRGPLLFFLIPAAVLAPLARLRALRRLLAFLLHPVTSLAVWMLVFLRHREERQDPPRPSLFFSEEARQPEERNVERSAQRARAG